MATVSSFRTSEQRSPALLPIARRVLVLSEDQEFANSIVQFLKNRDFEVLSVNPTKSGLEVQNAEPPIDLMLFDIGESAADHSSWMKQLADLQGSGSTPRPILLLVQAHQVPEAIEALQLGAYDYLVRPFSDQQLLAAAERVIEYRRLRMQNDLFRYHLEQLIAARTQILQNSMQQLELSYDVTLEALGNALDLKDAETEGHSKRVTAYTLALGRAVGLDESQLRMVGRGAFLHDIGKMAIPDAILRKPGKLTAEERETMRTHSELGYKMIRKIPYLREASEIVYAHQECFDGSGYPRGLRGEQIHIGARIFAVADTLDAITSNRPYRKANSIAQARREVLRCSGTQFDPAIVDVFLATPDSIWQNLREGIMRDGPEFSPFGYTFGAVT